jgi:hypothetical protein
MFWKEGINKKIKNLINFDVDSEEFNQLVQTSHPDLGGQPALAQPFDPPNVSSQPHTSIMDVREPFLQLMDDVWKNNRALPPSSISHWLASPRDALLPHVSTSIVASTAYVVHSPPKSDRMPLTKIPSDKWKKSIEVQSIDYVGHTSHTKRRGGGGGGVN